MDPIDIVLAAGGVFDVLDAGVVGLDLARGGAGDDEDFDLVPPPADSAVELVSSVRPAASTRSLSSSFAAFASARELVRSRSLSCYLTFHTAWSLPYRLELVGRVVGGEDLLQPVNWPLF